MFRGLHAHNKDSINMNSADNDGHAVILSLTVLIKCRLNFSRVLQKWRK